MVVLATLFVSAILFSAPVAADHPDADSVSELSPASDAYQSYQDDRTCNEIADTPYVPYGQAILPDQSNFLNQPRLQNAIVKRADMIVPEKSEFCIAAFASTRNIRELHCRAYKDRDLYTWTRDASGGRVRVFNGEVLERQVSLALSAAELRLNYIRAVACSKSEDEEAFKNEIAKISNPYADEDGDLDHTQGSLAHRAPFNNSNFIGRKDDSSTYYDPQTAFFNLLNYYAKWDKTDLQAMLGPYKTNLADRFNHRRAVGISLSGLDLPLTVGQGNAQRDGIGRMRQQSYNNILTALDVVGKMEDALAERERVDSSIRTKRATLNSALNAARSELILAADWFNTEFYEMVNIVRFQTLAR